MRRAVEAQHGRRIGQSIFLADPVLHDRAKKLALLTSRAALIQDLLGLKLSSECMHDFIERERKLHGLPYAKPRGNSFGEDPKLWFRSPADRMHGSFLLKLFFSANTVTRYSQDVLEADAFLDNAIFAYNHYLATFCLRPDSAQISFEKFICSTRLALRNALTLYECKSCSASYIPHFSATNIHRCPVCSDLGLAEVPSTRHLKVA